MKKSRLNAIINAITFFRGFMTDEEALCAPAFFPEWNDSKSYAVDDRILYGGTLYKCLYPHMSQSTWTPADSPSLWVRIDDPAIEWPDWIQPTGSTDAYPMGAKVSHNGKHWISILPANAYEPGVYGWDEAREE